MGHYGQSQTPGQGQDIGRYPAESNVTAINGVIGEAAKAMSLLSSESSARMPFSPFRPLTVARVGIPLNLEL